MLGGLLFFLGTASSIARARDAAALSWVRAPGAETCISAIELGRRVERHIGPVLVSAAEADVSVEGRITADPEGYQAIVTVSDDAGHILGKRRLHGSQGDCRAMDQAIVFVVAVAVDPHGALAALPADLAPSNEDDPAAELYGELQAEPRQPEPATPFETATTPPSAPEPREPQDDSEDTSFGLAVTAGGAVAAPLLPRVTAGLQVGLAWELLRRWPLRLTGRYWVPQDVPIAILDTPARLALLQLDAGICPRLLSAGRWRAGACAGLAIGRFASEAQGQGRSHVRWLAGPQLGIYGSVGITGPWRIRLDLAAQALRPRHRITYVQGDQTVTAYRLPWASARADISMALHF